LSVAFTKEESAETASETQLPDRPISPYPNLVTKVGLTALERQLREAKEARDPGGEIALVIRDFIEELEREIRSLEK
jgi:hypothetical protein